MPKIDEIASDVFRISTYIPEVNVQFNQFLIRDEQPLLYHTGMKALFEMVHPSVASLVDPVSLRWIGFSHFEADECGSLRQWQRLAPHATAVCSLVAKMVNVDDVVTLERMAGLRPQIIAPMHGSTFIGDGCSALREAALVMKQVLGFETEREA